MNKRAIASLLWAVVFATLFAGAGLYLDWIRFGRLGFRHAYLVRLAEAAPDLASGALKTGTLFLQGIYVGAASLLVVYALNFWILTLLFLRHRTDHQPRPQLRDFPRVTVQLPIFNEALVVERLIRAVARLEWPRDRLQIQVLDDSTDETTAIAQAQADAYRAQGVNIELNHRALQSGFKAGALKEGLDRATGDFIAIFDADFVPAPDWLSQTIPYFLDRPRLGMVQTRWGHLNRDYSPLTHAQAIGLDGHFSVEQTARQRSRLLMNFNGTAGIWRRSCISDAGGWQSDTLCEDLDLSYRAQLGDWECMFLPDVVTPAELPPQLAAFKRQQFRWAKGYVQCLKKLGGRVATARLPLVVRWQALVQMSAYLAHPLIVALLLANLPLILITGRLPWLPGFFSLLSLGPLLMYAVSQRALYPRTWLRHYAFFPVLALLGIGIALNNTRAAFEGLLGVSGIFQRTPKFRIEARGSGWRGSQYALPMDSMVLGELALALYAAITVLAALRYGNAHAIPYLLLYAVSFGYVGLQGVWDSRPTRRSGSGSLSRLGRVLSRLSKLKGLIQPKKPPHQPVAFVPALALAVGAVSRFGENVKLCVGDLGGQGPDFL